MIKALLLFSIISLAATASAADLVILHTNDTHSNIEPDAQGRGGILQRKAVIDSVRAAEKNVILIDAGDMVQGTLYFKFFKGDVEYPLFNLFDYDVRVLGNHEFDNGLDNLAGYYKDAKGARLSANYDFSDTPLKGIFEPYVIKKVDGKRIGIIGLNVDPHSLIASDNTEGVKFLPIIKTANETAAYLKNKKKCDLVIAVTHIGYINNADSRRETDVMLARQSRDIDVIIGGHSHTTIDPSDPKSPPHLLKNAQGRPVLIAQTGKYGKYVGEIRIDLDRLKSTAPSDYGYRLIPVTDRFAADKLDPRIDELLRPYKHQVDSVNAHVIAKSMYDLPNGVQTGGYPNFAGDFGLWFGRHIADSLSQCGKPVHVDLAIMNVGGIRQPMPAGDVTEGEILSSFPFSNRVMIIALKGRDIIDAMRVAAKRGGEAISSNMRVVSDARRNLRRVVLDHEEMDPDKTYYVATIDYLANGNDGMETLANHSVVWSDDKEMSAHMLRYVEHFGELGLPIAPDQSPRFVKESYPQKK